MAGSSEAGKVALLGATGQLGTDVVKAAKARGVDLVALGHEHADVTDPASLQKALEAARPRVVVNSAAFHQVDKCEEDPAEAYRVNAVGALHVARAAKAVGARVVYVSTDYVFGGAKPAGQMYTEADLPEPLNTYGASKLAGEHSTRLANPDSLVVRVSSLYGVSGARGKGGNFIETILGRAKQGQGLKVVNDQHMTPTYTLDAADAILRLAALPETGVVHVTNPQACTWHAFAERAVELCGLQVPVDPVPASTYPSKAARPANSALGTEKLTKLLGAPLRPWPDALRAYLKEKGHLA